VFPDKLGEIAAGCGADGKTFLQLEQEIIGATHQDFGDALTASWKFPPHLRAAVSAHHNPFDLPDEQRGLGMTIYCADTICCQERIGFDLLACTQQLTQEQLDAVGVSEEQLTDIRGALADGVAEAEAVLGANT